MLMLNELRRCSRSLLLILSLASFALVQGCFHSKSSTPATYSIGGTVSQLSGTGLVLQNSAGDDLPVSADGSFTFTTKLVDGAAYAVIIATQPTGENCTVSDGSGTVSAADVSNVSVLCDADPTGYYDLGSLRVSDGGIEDANLLAMISGNRIMMTSLASSNSGTDATLVYDGTMVFTSNNEFTAEVTVYTDGENPVSSIMSGTITEGSKITNGVLTSLGTDVGTGTFELTYSTSVNSVAAVISRIVTDEGNPLWQGSFNRISSQHTFEVDSDNNYIHVGSPANGGIFEFCAINGTITPIPDTSLYSVDVTLSSCGVGGVGVVELNYTGFAATTSLVDTPLVYMATESSKTYSVGGEYD